MRLTERKITAILKRKGHKLTPQRRAVLATICLSRDHMTPADIYEKVRRESPGIGLVTVYRTLDLLARLGLVCELHSGGACRSYSVRRPAGHHHHLVCTDCGIVADFTECGLGNLAETLANETGFEIEDHLLEFAGRCHNCRNK